MIPLFKVFMSDTVSKSVSDTLHSGYIGQGDKVEEFENLLSEFLDFPYVNAVNSGTSAIHLALHMVKDGVRDEVLTTPLTCSATNFPILANGLKIKWVDVDPNTCNISPIDLETKIGPKTLAIMVVHWGGAPCDLTEIKKIQSKCEFLYGYRPPIIEDCAHAIGSHFKGQKIGSHGNFCTFSFQAIKHLTTGDGGLLVCPDEKSHQRAKLLRWYGLDRSDNANFRCEQNVTEWGFKFNMNDISASIGIENFKHLNWIVSQHQLNAQYLKTHLKNCRCMKEHPKSQSAYWIFTMRVERREDFVRHMEKHGIATSRVHNRNDKHECVQEFTSSDLPGTDEVCDDMVCIPCGWWLSKSDLDTIVFAILQGW